ncbi:MAG TPA: thymidylate synthase [Candidatus Kapabacteria bacterium]|nr:thymidylate synthase [Candidatus Kapabacteria bacterium]
MIVEDISSGYPLLNKYLMDNGVFQKSRYGDTFELIDFRLEIINPMKRVVGCNMRDSNIFFLLAEALWIWLGRNDVEFLTIFNSKMFEFSDDGKSFHAPYGFRLRNYGYCRPEDIDFDADMSLDQIHKAIKIFKNNNDDRRVVLSIWDSFLDLDVISKDIPCNDMVMLKIRDNKLRTTIANRSNDIAWGLGTNIFQFSFITELMSLCIPGVSLGTQTHNIQSLHYYTNNLITKRLVDNYVEVGNNSLYKYVNPTPFDFNFNPYGENVNRLTILDDEIKNVVESLLKLYKNEINLQEYLRRITHLTTISKKLYEIANILAYFVIRKISGMVKEEYTETIIINLLEEFELDDYLLMAINWLYNRISDEGIKQRVDLFLKQFAIFPADTNLRNIIGSF